MKAVRVTLNSLVLTLADIAGIVVGFVISKLVGTGNQIAIQVPIAVFLSVLLFVAWTVSLRILPGRRLVLIGLNECLFAYACSLAWNPLIFVPLHLVTQGYLTSPSNVLGLLLYQLPVNALALLAAWSIHNLRSGSVPQEGSPPNLNPRHR